MTSDSSSAHPRGEGIHVRHLSNHAYVIEVRGHEVVVDQPAAGGGDDTGPTPTELFVASLGACVAYYAGEYLARHGFSRDGLGVEAEFDMARGHRARVEAIRVRIVVPPDLPAERWPALSAVVSHCTVHNTLREPPEIRFELTSRYALA